MQEMKGELRKRIEREINQLEALEAKTRSIHAAESTGDLDLAYKINIIEKQKQALELALKWVSEARKEFDVICPNKDIAYLKRVNPLAGQLVECIVKWLGAE
jgi:chaperonin cofactor prefoldin